MPTNENIDKTMNNESIIQENFSTNIERLKSLRHFFSGTENEILSPTLCVQYVV